MRKGWESTGLCHGRCVWWTRVFYGTWCRGPWPLASSVYGFEVESRPRLQWWSAFLSILAECCASLLFLLQKVTSTEQPRSGVGAALPEELPALVSLRPLGH